VREVPAANGFPIWSATLADVPLAFCKMLMALVTVAVEVNGVKLPAELPAVISIGRLRLAVVMESPVVIPPIALEDT
jgi:hypothetical protein